MLKHQLETKGQMALIVGLIRQERRQAPQYMSDFFHQFQLFYLNTYYYLKQLLDLRSAHSVKFHHPLAILGYCCLEKIEWFFVYPLLF